MRPALLVALALVVAACDASAPPSAPLDLSAEWAETTPEAAGLDAAAVDAAIARMAALPRARSLVAVRGGRIAAEHYFQDGPGALHDVRSVTKTVVGMLTGIAIAEGHLALDTPIGPLLAGVVEEVPAGHAAITVGQLAAMTSGIAWDELSGPSYADWITSGDPLGYVLAQPLASAPGAAFTYNSGAVHLLGVVLEEAVGEPLPAYADRVLFGPIGVGARTWEPLPGGRVNGGAGLDLRARDLARLGQLILQDGRSADRAVLPPGWVDAWTAPAHAWRAGSPLGDYTYGRLVWAVDGAAGGALAWGYGGQFVYAVPAFDLVLVATTDWRGLSGEGGPGALTTAVMAVLADLVDAAR